MDGSLIVLIGFPVLYLTGSLRRTAKCLKIRGSIFVVYFLGTAALTLLPLIHISAVFAINIAGLFYCLGPAVYIVCMREFPVGLPIAAALCVLFSCTAELLFGDYTIPYLPYAEGVAIAIVALVCMRRRAALFVPVLTALYESAGHAVRLLSGMDLMAWFSSICAVSVAIAVCLFAAEFRLPARRISRHAET